MGPFGKRKQLRLVLAERAKVSRRMANEDLTVLGEQLAELHYETLTTDLAGEIGGDYQQALDAYEQAKRLLRETDPADAMVVLQPILDDGRFRLACVLARQEGRPLPQRLPACYFNGQHGPSHSEVDWAPSGGVTRRVPVCLSDLNRLEQRTMPAVRMVRVGTELVPWFAADKAFGLLSGDVDIRALKNLRAYHHGQSVLYGADPMVGGPGVDSGAAGWG